MKTVTKLLLTGMIAMLCGSIAKAQYSNVLAGATLIYSNAFNGSASMNITNTPPNYINPVFGGSNNAVWIDAGGPGDTNAFYANGTVGTLQGDTILLPFKAQSNQVYTLTATVNITGNPGNWMTCGYAQNYSEPGIANSAPNGGGVNSYAWTLRNYTGNTEYFAGNAGNNNIYNSVPAGPIDAGTYTYVQILNTTSNHWMTTAFFNNVQLGSPYTYATPPSIGAVGLGQHALTTPANYQWTSLALFANQLIILQQPVSAAVNEGSASTVSVQAGGTPPFYYQWYTNGVAIGNATNASLVLNPVSAYEASSNYIVVVTNVYGAVTSTPASLAVYTSPQFLSANPIAYTNLMTLFGGSGSYLGSSPSFSVNVGGALPLSYFWLTNGVAVGGANSNNFTFANCQMGGPTNFTCIVSNSYNTATNTWMAQYIPTPTAPYPQLVLTDAPAAYWRLDETNIDQTLNENDGEVCNDFMSGNNGLYTNVALAQTPGYFVVSNGVPLTNDPTEMAAYFGPPLPVPGEAFGVGTNIDFSSYTNAEFTVSVWANGAYLGDSTPEPVNGGLVCKGGFGTEEFALDDGGSGGAVRFMVRNAANSLSGAGSTLKLTGDNNWHLLVGVCDESNGVVNLYIDGLLSAQTTITKGSGVLPSALAPITIGADGGGQFNGGLNDVAIFPYALNANQVDNLYKAADGVNPLTFTAPVPPTNVAWRVNQTLTIPASAIGAPPLGYYWTNLTIGGIVGGSGVHGATGTSVVSTITCTLTITNAGQSWSGDQLALYVTNATGSTNLVTTLFAYPPPITIGYTNAFLYSNEFNGGTWNIAGTATTVANSLIGGTNSTWTDVLGTNDTTGQGGTSPGYLEANGLDNCALPNSWIFPFTPHPGFVYTETATVTFSATPGSWVGEGFAQNFVSNATVSGAFNAGPNGIDWILMQNSGNAEFIDGENGTFVTNENGFFSTTLNVPHTMVVVLDTTQPQWAQYAWIDGVPAGTNVFSSNPTIGSVGITQYQIGNSPNNITWNSWSFSAVSPNGFPPYLITTSPPGTILMTNTTITIPATGYGSGPWGYYWSDNSTIVASGTTNITAPNVANLSVPASSLSAGTLDLVLTNALGTNISSITLVSPITTLAVGVTNGNVYLSWPSAFKGVAQLQAQTNSVGVGLSTNWFNVVGSTSTNQVVFPINQNNGTVFYRLHP